MVLDLFERKDVDESELLGLIGHFRVDGQPAVDHVRRQLSELGVVETTAHADAAIELAQPVLELLAWLTKRQRLSSATVLQAHLVDLSKNGQDLGAAVRIGDANAASLALVDLQGTVERVRSLSQSNRDATVSEAQRLRSVGAGLSAVERFAAVGRLWLSYLQPLRELVSVRGEMDQRLDGVQATLREGEQRFLAHGAVSRACSQAIARLTRMRRAAADDHLAAVREIAPLYQKLRRESRWVLGASRALAQVLTHGSDSLEFNRRIGLTGWRSRGLISDQQLRSRLAALVGYVPAAAAPLAAAPPLPDMPFLVREDLHAALKAAVPIADVFELILTRWPALPLAAQLRAFGHVVGGNFGAVDVVPASAPRTYSVASGSVEAWAVALPRVAS